MKTYVVLGGYGEMGKIIVRDLFETARDTIIVAGRDIRKAKLFADSFKTRRVKAVAVNVTNLPALAKFLSGKSVCINSTNYYFNLHVMRASLKAKVPYLDLGGLYHMTKKQLALHSAFKKAGVLAILGCGATPGITNIMAAYGADFFDKIESIHIKFAGADFTNYKMPFVLPYSAQTLFDEFSMKAAVLENGRIRMKPAMSDEKIDVFPKPVNTAQCGNILHSELATFPISFKKKGIKNCTFKGSFGREFTDLFKMLVSLGFAKEPYRKLAVDFFNNFLPPSRVKIRDLEYLRVTLQGKKNGSNKKIILDSLAKSDPRWNAPAGTVDTAVPPSIIAQMIVNGKIGQKGVLPPEKCIDPTAFFQALKKRKIEVTLSISSN